MEFVVSHLSKSYGKHQVIKDADYAFEEGKIYGLLGRNGAGKTTAVLNLWINQISEMRILSKR